MLIPVAPSLPPAPAPSERLRVGQCVVDIPLREIHAPHARRPRRVTPKAIGVLLVLVEHAGKVVSRETLLARVWPDTLPTDDVITQAITQLRKALADEARDERGERQTRQHYIETIAKTGYRLLAPVVRLDGIATATDRVASANAPAPVPASVTGEAPALPAATASSAPSPARPVAGPRARRVGWLAGVAAGLLGAGVLGWWAQGTRGISDRFATAPAIAAAAMWPLGSERPYRLLTSAPGFELSPTLSPDSAMVAYSASLPGRRGTVIMVQTTDQSLPRQLSEPADGVSDRVPAWSPDGREIAFVRAGPGAECQLLVIPANGGAERRVGGCDADDLIGFSWTPDGRGLIFGSMSTTGGLAGIRVLDLASGQWRALDYDASGADIDHAPRYSPDGRWIVFVRNPQLGDLWRVPATGGRAERLTAQSGEMRGWDWLPDGAGLVFGRRVGLQTRLYRLDLDSRQVRDLGIDDAQSPDIAARTGMMTFVRRRPQFGIFRLPRSGSGPVTAAEHLFASSARDTQPRVSPDARQLVFTSDRSGGFGLWWADLQRPDTLRLIEGIQPETRSVPQWSPDSRSLLVAGVDPDGRSGIHEIVPASGQVSLLPVPVEHPLQADYLPDPQRLLVTAQRADGGMRATLLDRGRQPWRTLASLDDVSLLKVDARNRRVLFTRLSTDGLWQADLALSHGSVRRVSAEVPTRWRYQSWALAEDGSVDYLDSLRGCLTSLRPLAGAQAGREGGQGVTAAVPRARCLHPDRLASTTGFSVSAAADAVFVALAIADGTDIAFMPAPLPPASAPRTFVPGWLK